VFRLGEIERPSPLPARVDRNRQGAAKSPLMAGIGLYFMGWYDVPRAEIYRIGQETRPTCCFVTPSPCAAPTCQRGGGREPPLGEVLIRGEGDNAWKIEHPETGSRFQSLTNGEAISGRRPVRVLTDVIHEFKNAHPIETWQRAIAKMSATLNG